MAETHGSGPPPKAKKSFFQKIRSIKSEDIKKHIVDQWLVYAVSVAGSIGFGIMGFFGDQITHGFDKIIADSLLRSQKNLIVRLQTYDISCTSPERYDICPCRIEGSDNTTCTVKIEHPDFSDNPVTSERLLKSASIQGYSILLDVGNVAERCEIEALADGQILTDQDIGTAIRPEFRAKQSSTGVSEFQSTIKIQVYPKLDNTGKRIPIEKQVDIKAWCIDGEASIERRT